MNIYIYIYFTYRLFWYQVFTCVSVRLSFAANSIRSWTLRYFWRSNDFSKQWSWWSVNAVRALRGFLIFMTATLIDRRRRIQISPFCNRQKHYLDIKTDRVIEWVKNLKHKFKKTERRLIRIKQVRNTFRSPHSHRFHLPTLCSDVSLRHLIGINV